jgi:hypothetical protein
MRWVVAPTLFGGVAYKEVGPSELRIQMAGIKAH